ncbi:H-NS histone family protein [Ramlibacter sp. AW1]|uniref:H-NS histone family protein n=1 Tax=Ramlibacter aurantiacus TaxID=2801330 RepID=A0A937D8T2_9BURK|nr:H-NS histone family protein [Ramlibacter aurantiacus]MBL0423383.1 H-NS histone family protein [Ramlibacter aurantiacus]
MATYLELKAQAEKLMAEAEQLRQMEIEQAIADIKSKMELYGISPRDLGFHAAPAVRRTGTRGGQPKAIRYRGPNGETWAGGRGRKPEWVVRVLKEGKSLDQFAV